MDYCAGLLGKRPRRLGPETSVVELAANHWTPAGHASAVKKIHPQPNSTSHLHSNICHCTRQASPLPETSPIPPITPHQSQCLHLQLPRAPPSSMRSSRTSRRRLLRSSAASPSTRDSPLLVPSAVPSPTVLSLLSMCKSASIHCGRDSSAPPSVNASLDPQLIAILASRPVSSSTPSPTTGA